MPWKVKKALLLPSGEVYAHAGTYLDDTDPYALAAKPNQVVRVQVQDAVGVKPRVIVYDDPEPEQEAEAEEEPRLPGFIGSISQADIGSDPKEEDEGIDL